MATAFTIYLLSGELKLLLMKKYIMILKGLPN